MKPDYENVHRNFASNRLDQVSVRTENMMNSSVGPKQESKKVE